MISVIPNATAQDTNGVFALLALLPNAEEYQKRLATLVSEKQQAIEALKKSEALHDEAKAIKSDAERCKSAVVTLQTEVAERAKAANAAHGSLGQREAKVVSDEKALAARIEAHTADHTAREARLAAAEKEIAGREAQTAEALRAAQASKKEHEAKLAQLKAALS